MEICCYFRRHKTIVLQIWKEPLTTYRMEKSRNWSNNVHMMGYELDGQFNSKRSEYNTWIFGTQMVHEARHTLVLCFVCVCMTNKRSSMAAGADWQCWPAFVLLIYDFSSSALFMNLSKNIIIIIKGSCFQWI